MSKLDSILVDKVGIYSTILKYYDYLWYWRRIYTTLNKNTRQIWTEKENQFKQMHTIAGLDMKAYLHLTDLHQKEKKIRGVGAIIECDKDTNAKDTGLFINLSCKDTPMLINVFNMINVPKFDKFVIDLDYYSHRYLNYFGISNKSLETVEELIYGEHKQFFIPFFKKVCMSGTTSLVINSHRSIDKGIDWFISTLKSSPIEEVMLDSIRLRKDDLKHIFESGAHMKKLEFGYNTNLKYIGETFGLDEKIDYQYENIIFNVDGLNQSHHECFIKELGKTSIIENCKNFSEININTADDVILNKILLLEHKVRLREVSEFTDFKI